jgi:hypothetical protein
VQAAAGSVADLNLAAVGQLADYNYLVFNGTKGTVSNWQVSPVVAQHKQ